MKIKKLTLNNFMAFGNAEMNWADNINIICGENSTGKTTLLKVMYSVIKPFSNINRENLTKEMEEQLFVKKLQGVFRPDEMKIGRLVSRKQGSNRTEFSVDMEKQQKITVGFGNRQENHADVSIEQGEKARKYDVIYIPTKEMISTVEHFVSLYDEYHIDFEEMYYDLAKLLDRPLSKGPNTIEQNQVLSNLEDIMKGQIVQKNKKFYFKIKGEGEFEMGLLSDGYRKLSMIIYMILSGSLNKNTILFWDEPETNMNPKMIRPIVQAMVALAQMGVQIFEDYVGKYLADRVIRVIIFTVLFTVFYASLHIVIVWLNLLSRLPIIYGLNKIAGAVLGLTEALIFVWIGCLVLTLFSGSPIGRSMIDQINGSIWLTWLYDHNMLSYLVVGLVRSVL